MRPTKSHSVFTRFAKATARATGRPSAFLIALLVVLVWAATGPIFQFSDTWQLVINTSTTIITFLMVFLIQSTQNRDTQAMQVKLDELIRVSRGHNVLLDRPQSFNPHKGRARSRRPPLWTILLPFALSACSPATPAAVNPLGTVVQDSLAIIAAANRFSRAYERGDAVEMTGIYTSDGVIFPDQSEALRGPEAIRAYWTLGPGRRITHHRLTPTELRIQGDVAYDFGVYEVSGEDRGQAWGPAGGKYVVLWRRGADGQWRMHLDMWNRRSGPPPWLLGKFADDYGNRFSISATEWTQLPGSRYHIVSWVSDRQYLLAQNDSANPGDHGLWTRIDWMPFTGMEPYKWGFCLSAYQAPTREAAEATVIARRDTPRTGCNGHPFSRMQRAEPR